MQRASDGAPALSFAFSCESVRFLGVRPPAQELHDHYQTLSARLPSTTSYGAQRGRIFTSMRTLPLAAVQEARAVDLLLLGF